MTGSRTVTPPIRTVLADDHELVRSGLRSELADAFDFVATRDDVEHGKPDPEIYQLVARDLNIPASECLVIEDSPSGVQAALAAGMWCVAVTTPFTRQRIHTSQLLDLRWIVDDPTRLTAVVQHIVAERQQD